jgi:hypothetical protein
MPKLVWDKVGEKLYEAGVSKGVLWVQKVDGTYDNGVAWNGLSNVTESPEGAEANPIYADNQKYLNLYSSEDFKASIEAYTYPDEFGICDGSIQVATGVYIGQQKRRAFAFAYQTGIGNDVEALDLGYKIHIVYGCMAAPTEKAYGTVNESPEAATFSWEITTTPVELPGFKPLAHIIIDSTKNTAEDMAAFEDLIYGTAIAPSVLQMPAEIIALFPALAQG